MKTLKLILFFSILFTFGCGSSDLTHDNKIWNDDLVDDFDWVQNDDFKKPKKIQYLRENDTFDELDENAITKNIIRSESLMRLSDSQLEDVDENTTDIISQIISNCYQHNFKQAFALADKYFDRYQNSPSYWNQVGTCYLVKDNNRKALLYYNKALNLNKKYSPAINNIGALYVKMGQDQKGFAAFNEAAKLSSFTYTPILNKGLIYLKYGHAKVAIKILYNLYRKGKHDVLLIHALANAYLLDGDLKKSLRFYKKLDSDMLHLPYVGINYSLVLFYSGKKKSAREVLTNIDPDKLGKYSDYFSAVKNVIN